MSFEIVKMKDIDRATYIGSSDASRLMRGEARELYFEKTDQAQAQPFDPWLRALGHATQPINLAFWFAAHYPEGQVSLWTEGEDPELGFALFEEPRILAHPDGLVLGDGAMDNIIAGVDAKHHHAELTPLQVYDFAYWQAQFFMMIFGLPEWSVSPIYGNQLGEALVITRDSDHIGQLHKRCVDLLDAIDKKIPPGFAATRPVEATIRPATTYGALRMIDGATANYGAELKEQLLLHKELKPKADEFTAVKEKVKMLMPADARLVFFDELDLCVERDRGNKVGVKEKTSKILTKHQGIV